MEEILQQILTGNIGLVIIVLILWRAGVLRFLLTKNGNGNSSREIEELKQQLELLTENHLHQLQEGITSIKSCQKDIKNYLENFERFGIKIRKE